MVQNAEQEIYVIILAAGKGTRMKSSRHKVLHPLAGKPMIQHLVESVEGLSPKGIFMIVGHEADQLKQWASNTGNQIHWVHQDQQLGTAHAVLTAIPELRKHNVLPDARVLILSGDVPLTTTATLESLCKVSTDFSLLTHEMSNPFGYGRILRDEAHNVIGIAEEKDATPAQKKITEVNTNVMGLKFSLLDELLPQVKNDNAQKEYYLPDLVSLAARKKENSSKVVIIKPAHDWEVQGVNDRVQLEALERLYQLNLIRSHMVNGLSVADSSRVDIRGYLEFGIDCTFDINILIEGRVKLGHRVKIGPNVRLKDVVIGDDVEINGYSDLELSEISNSCQIGPYARVRPGTKLAEGAKLGNFVETKNATLGKGSKINHLSYAGDCQIGNEVNIGAGTIFCNYDGVNKHTTTLGHNVFIGSNSSLVAPVTIESGATVGAGSTITQDVPAETLVIARARPKLIEGWKRPTKK